MPGGGSNSEQKAGGSARAREGGTAMHLEISMNVNP